MMSAIKRVRLKLPDGQPCKYKLLATARRQNIATVTNGFS